MPAYYVNRRAQSNGDHEVHESGCYYMPSDANRVYLGVLDRCQDAVREAKKHYAQSNGCATCSPACHTG